MRSLTVLLIFGVLAGSDLRAQSEDEVFPPKPIPADRYEAMMKRSPFVLPTVEEVTIEATADWASDFQIVSVMQIAGEPVILTRRLSTDERIPIRLKPNAHGIRLINLRMSPDPREVSAVIEMGEAEGTIQYDPAILSGVPTSVAPGNPALQSE